METEDAALKKARSILELLEGYNPAAVTNDGPAAYARDRESLAAHLRSCAKSEARLAELEAKVSDIEWADTRVAELLAAEQAKVRELEAELAEKRAECTEEELRADRAEALAADGGVVARVEAVITELANEPYKPRGMFGDAHKDGADDEKRRILGKLRAALAPGEKP